MKSTIKIAALFLFACAGSISAKGQNKNAADAVSRSAIWEKIGRFFRLLRSTQVNTERTGRR